MSTKNTGNVSELAVMLALARKGKQVLVPYKDNGRYDLVIDDGEFVRVQVKTGRLIEGVIRFSVCSVDSRDGSKRRDYRSDADVFGVYCPDLNTVYIVPVDHVGRKEATLRIERPKNRQKRGIRWADDYVLK